MQREIKQVWTVNKQQQNPKHIVGLVLEPGHWEEYDPFLLLAEDWFQQGTFDNHPHRGIETVTYVLEGKLNHYDNESGSGQLGPGDVQWMTAGRGVIHKEDPEPGETVHSLQLWVNLPSDEKMAEPRYQNLKAATMPIRNEDGCRIRVFSGSSADVVSPTQNHVPVTMVEMTLEAGKSVVQDVPADYNGFFYVLEGRGIFGANEVQGGPSQVLWMGQSVDDADGQIVVRAEEPLRVLMYAGRPVGEPVVQYGPFVMNTKEQIQQAIRDYQEGRFTAPSTEIHSS